MYMLEDFPKIRPVLPDEYQQIYVEHYKRNREGASPATSVAQKMERWMHLQVAKGSAADKRTLEIGAGTLNQLPFELVGGAYDIIEPFRALYENSPHQDLVRCIYPDIADVPLTNRYDRITSIATFEHICELPMVVARSALLLDSGGTLQAAIPSEGTILWTLGWKLTTGIEFKSRHGLNYEVMMKHEHVNTAADVERVLRCLFGQVERRVFGVCRALSFYQYFLCSDPILERCQKFAELSSAQNAGNS
jgi:hypothetical protein